MSHTPGPWKVWDKEGKPDFCVAQTLLDWIVTENEEAYLKGRSKDDAHLIAAAPDLLAACKAALERLEAKCQCETEDCANHRARKMLKIAIAKARGEAERW